jgi:lipoprotein-anchoring transpeptidase ErfK/SrfK
MVTQCFRCGVGVLVVIALGPPSSTAAGAAAGVPDAAAVSAPATLKLTMPPWPEASDENFSQPVRSDLEAQIALSREGLSCGSIDGIRGPQTAAALRAFQERNGLPPSGELDDTTRARLILKSPALTRMTVSPEDQAELRPLSPTWLGKSEQVALGFETVLELLAERTHASPALLKRLNPGIEWQDAVAGTLFIVPSVELTISPERAARLQIRLGDRSLEACAADGKLIARFPVSIARMAEKRPEGELHVTVVIPDPNYTFDPEVFPESEEGRQLARKLVLPPGPNNPVGVAWIGLDRAGYGIHGAPLPELIGRTESHGCFRLANWDARTLLKLAWVGMPVVVDP